MTDQTEPQQDYEDDDRDTIDETGEESVDAFEEKVEAGQTGAPKAAGAAPFRVEEEIHGQVPVWRGVRDCNQVENALSAFRPVWDRWVARTIAAHPNNTALAKGYYDFHYRWENKTEWDGTRKCKGVCTRVRVYVDFE